MGHRHRAPQRKCFHFCHHLFFWAFVFNDLKEYTIENTITWQSQRTGHLFKMLSMADTENPFIKWDLLDLWSGWIGKSCSPGSTVCKGGEGARSRPASGRSHPAARSHLQLAASSRGIQAPDSTPRLCKSLKKGVFRAKQQALPILGMFLKWKNIKSDRKCLGLILHCLSTFSCNLWHFCEHKISFGIFPGMYKRFFFLLPPLSRGL